ncbi:MAG TPA: hypothetical protein VK666_18030, partial [Chryseolinea sp.]|nr:hypothetical protein [Chryseolinea sp.]
MPKLLNSFQHQVQGADLLAAKTLLKGTSQYYFTAVSPTSLFGLKHFEQRFTLIAIFLLFAMLCNTIESQGQVIRNLIPKGLVYDLKVSRVEQGPLLEFTPVTVRFKLTISVGGNTGPDPAPKPLRICSKVSNSQTTCFTIDAPILDHEYTGTVIAMTSFAGQNSPIRLVVLGAPDQGEDYGSIRLTESEVMAPVAARYEIAISGFEVVTSRSNQTDTQWFTLQGMISSDPPHPSALEDAGNLAGFHWVQPPHCVGDNGDGKHFVNDVKVGPYDLVPEREKDLRFVFHLDNIGDRHKEEIAALVANGFSKVGMVILGGYEASQGNASGQSFAKELDNVMEQMHSSATASCDGKLATDIRVIPNTTLANRPDL